MIGPRLKQARIAEGMALRELASAVGVSHTAIDKFEKNTNTPSSSMLISLADSLSVSVDYLLRPPAPELTDVEYRSHSGFTKQLSAQVIADISDQVGRQLSLYDLLPGTLPEFKLPRLPAKIESLDEIENIALKIRDAWNLGYNPIPDLFDTLEEHGIVVLHSNVFGEKSFSGVSAWAEKTPVIIVSGEWPGDRQRFTACHELGHIVLHHRLADGIDEEKACDRFAGAFLVPKPSVIGALGHKRNWLDTRELALLKQEFGLSMQGWIYRARDCGVLNSNKLGPLFGTFKKNGWNITEPGKPFPQETPRRFKQTVFRAVAEDIIGESKAIEFLGITRRELGELLADVDCS